MVDAVLIFGFLLATFEFVVLSMIPPKYRLRLLGSKPASSTVHVLMLLLNLWIHWGTLTGTMSATLSFIVSIGTLAIARLVYGTITNNSRVRRGIFGYTTQELTL